MGARMLLRILVVPLLFAISGATAGQPDPSRIPVIDATDRASLLEHLDRHVIVAGTVASARWSRTGKVMNIELEGSEGGERAGLLAVVFESRRGAFDAAWNGDFTKAIAGRRVRLHGQLNEYGGYDEAQKGRPQMILNVPDQVTLVDAGTGGG